MLRSPSRQIAADDLDGEATANTASNTLTVAYTLTDTTPLTVTFSDVPANHDGTSAFMVIVTLSETADDFDLSDITFSAASGMLSGSGTSYTLTVTPTDTNSITIDIAAGSFTDASNNMNTAPGNIDRGYVGATTAPTVTFTDPPANHSNSEFMVTVTLSEPSTDFVVGDIEFPSNNASGTLTGSGTDYELTVTPTDTNAYYH
ncbi:MAG: Ig-like domain-containing protein [Arenicellales bacterium WSBS_2016_MAG_OTU3]